MQVKVIKNDSNYNLDDVVCLLKQTYWAKDLSSETIKNSIDHSVSFFMYLDSRLIGFCRAITDYATNYYLCDVVVHYKYRNSGYGKVLLDAVINDSEIGHLKGLLLTKDAHEFYQKFGFYSRENAFMQKDKKL